MMVFNQHEYHLYLSFIETQPSPKFIRQARFARPLQKDIFLAFQKGSGHVVIYRAVQLIKHDKVLPTQR